MAMLAFLALGVIVVAIVAGVFVASLYNSLVTLRNQFQNAFSQIDVQLKRRYDLIPNLVETAKGYLAHERDTLEAVIAARNGASSAAQRAANAPDDPAAMQGLMAAEGLLGGALGKFFALSEAYPDLKANTTMNSLMEELTSTENKVAFARQAFNDAVMLYNIATEKFPANIVAGMFQFRRGTLLEFDEPDLAKAPTVSFGA
jgi:LemA protein